MRQIRHVYGVRPCRDHRGVDLISDALPFGRLDYDRLALVVSGMEKLIEALDKL